MAVKIFDLDADLLEDTNTRDLKELYNEDAVNQSLELFILHPYRIGKGVTNSLLGKLFQDITFKTRKDIERDFEIEIENNYQMINIIRLDTEVDAPYRRIYIKMEWSLVRYPLSGTFVRFIQT